MAENNISITKREGAPWRPLSFGNGYRNRYFKSKTVDPILYPSE